MFTGVSRDGAKSEPESRFRVERVAETGSTNDDLMARATNGESEGLVLVADVQRAGRGRRGRHWEAPPGSSLLSSWLFRPPPSVSPVAVSIAVGVAATDACRALGAGRTGLKWPNDLMAGDRKMGGMLAESVVRGHGVDAIVVGIGINVAAVQRSPEVAATSTSLEREGGRPDRDGLLAAMVAEVEQRYGRLVDGGMAELLEAWRRRLDTLGRRVRLELDDETFEGTAVDVEDDGTLRVDTDRGTRRITVADVVHLRPATGSGESRPPER
jgi:BirA family biotin operon repressor/biotin-[acetyl-CoA-carboxylase] ligase